MENTDSISKHTVSFGLSLALCAVLNALMVIAKESSKSVQEWMQKMTGHHWITHVAVVLLAFVFFGWCFARLNGGEGLKIPGNRLAGIVLWGTVAGVLIVLGFYAIAD